MTIPLRTRCLLIGKPTPEHLVGRPCEVAYAIHFPAWSRYTVRLENGGGLVPCTEEQLLVISPQVYTDQLTRIINSRITKGSTEL